MDALGFVVAFIGQGCRILGVGGVENIRRRGRQKRFSAATLIRTGLFAHSRNPLYLGNLLICCGLVIMANSYWWYVLALPGFIGVYWAIVLAEEAFLAERFGLEYEDYCRKVNRFVPRILVYVVRWRRARSIGNASCAKKRRSCVPGSLLR